MMEAVLGPMPEHIIQDASQTTAKYFTSRCLSCQGQLA